MRRTVYSELADQGPTTNDAYKWGTSPTVTPNGPPPGKADHCAPECCHLELHCPSSTNSIGTDPLSSAADIEADRRDRDRAEPCDSSCTQIPERRHRINDRGDAGATRMWIGSDWAGDTDSRRSISGVWMDFHEPLLSHSTTDYRPA